MVAVPFSSLCRTTFLTLALATASCGGGSGSDGGNPGGESNVRPVANAGADQNVDDGANVTLDASTSVDEDNDTLTFEWTQTGGATVVLSDADTAQPTFTAPTIAGGTQLEFTVIVTDSADASDEDNVTITVSDVTGPEVAYSIETSVLGDVVLTFTETIVPESLVLEGDFADAETEWNANRTELTLLSPEGGWESGRYQIAGRVADAQGNTTELDADIAIRLIFDTFQAASVVMGQPSFTTGNCNHGGAASANTLCSPYGQPTVSNGRLWVADSFNHRVLGYDGIPEANNAAASWVVGQIDFESNEPGTSASSIHYPVSATEHDGSLYLTDFGNRRILIYNTLPLTPPAIANHVIGQDDFVSSWGNCNSLSLYLPQHMTIVGDRLIVSDTNNNRVLVWNTVPATGGIAPDIVLGQGDLDHCYANDTNQDNLAEAKPDERTLTWPSAVWTDGEKLVVNDGGNNRVLIWNTFPTSNMQAADVVLGQSDFTQNECNDDDQDDTADAVTARVLCGPYRVWSNGVQLFVSDYGNNRVLGWNDIPTSNFIPADFVLGQSEFEHSTSNDEDQDGVRDAAPGSRTFTGPAGLAGHRAKLLVIDESNSRVLVFEGR